MCEFVAGTSSKSSDDKHACIASALDALVDAVGLDCARDLLVDLAIEAGDVLHCLLSLCCSMICPISRSIFGN